MQEVEYDIVQFFWEQQVYIMIRKDCHKDIELIIDRHCNAAITNFFFYDN